MITAGACGVARTLANNQSSEGSNIVFFYHLPFIPAWNSDANYSVGFFLSSPGQHLSKIVAYNLFKDFSVLVVLNRIGFNLNQSGFDPKLMPGE